MGPNFGLWREVSDLRREIDRAFEGFGRRPAGRRRSWFLPGRSFRGYPLINLYEDPEAIFVEALAPGLDTESIDIQLRDRTLVLQGEKKPLEGVKATDYHRSERATGRFSRMIHLNTDIEAEEVAAEYRDGVLLVRVPKSEKARPRTIAVDVK